MYIRRPNSPSLCPRCIELLPLLVDVSPSPKLGNAHSKWWHETYGKIGSIRGLDHDRCELCRILLKAFGRLPGFSPTDTDIRVNNCSLARYKGLEHNTCSFRVEGRQLELAPAVLPVVTTDEGEPVLAFTGRPVSRQFNPSLVKYWITQCTEQHGACKPERSSEDFDFPFRLIDVQRCCLVDAPLGARYVALSYVWGGVKQVMLNRKIRKYLEREGSITPDGLKEPDTRYAHVKEAVEAEGRVIPRTIRDAIKLCQLIDEPYLWTDSLCIMQDDDFQDISGAWTNADKMAQIPKMDIIYGASLLTIIGACGSDSNAGLPGVHPSNTRTSQVVEKIGDQIFVSIENDPTEAFWRSKWCERAWTFQEFLLSKRHLVFLPEQIVFHCNTRAWSEDHSLEFVRDQDWTYSPAWTKSYRLRPLQLPDRSRWDNEIFFPAIFVNQYFTDWLKNFLKRRLTVASDILFAFNGALALANRHLGGFLFGLPVEHWVAGLNWSVGRWSMYSGSEPHQGLTKRREGFPSWSWTGWMWDVPYHEELYMHLVGREPGHYDNIGMWRWTEPEEPEAAGELCLTPLTQPDMERWERLDFPPFSAFCLDETWTTMELPKYVDFVKNTPIPSHCIIIKTLTSSIFVDPKQPQSRWSVGQKAYSSLNFASENFIGIINWPLEWQDKIRQGQALPIIITGSFFNGPDSKFPDQTDEMDPTIACLVVRDIGFPYYERVTSFVIRFTDMQKLEWRPTIVVLK